jgi:hypothetical protein
MAFCLFGGAALASARIKEDDDTYTACGICVLPPVFYLFFKYYHIYSVKKGVGVIGLAMGSHSTPKSAIKRSWISQIREGCLGRRGFGLKIAATTQDDDDDNEWLRMLRLSDGSCCSPCCCTT